MNNPASTPLSSSVPSRVIPKQNWFSEKLKETKTVGIPYLNEVQIGSGFGVDERFSENQNGTGIKEKHGKLSLITFNAYIYAKNIEAILRGAHR